MTGIRAILAFGAVILAVNLEAGCFLHKKAIVSAPLPPPPAPIAAPVPAAPAEQPIPAPVPPAATPAAALPAITQPIKPSPFPPAAKPARTPARPATADVEPETPAPAPMPSLGVILSADQKKQLDASYQSDLRQANAALSRLSGRTLTPAQTDTVNRARAFILQAAQYHDRDLATAAEMARRARVLTQDLAGARPK